VRQLSTSFISGYHGCDRRVGERILKGEPFKSSNNEYDWLGPGIYSWEANPMRGLAFAREAMKRRGSRIRRPFVVGAVISMGLCLDLTTTAGIEQLRRIHETVMELESSQQFQIPRNPLTALLRPGSGCDSVAP